MLGAIPVIWVSVNVAAERSRSNTGCERSNVVDVVPSTFTPLA